MAAYWGRVAGIMVLLGVLATPPSGWSEEVRLPSLAQVMATEQDVHAIVNAVAVGKKPRFDGIQGEFPIRRKVYLSVPTAVHLNKNGFYIMLHGIVVAHNADNTYADPLQVWQGFKTEVPDREKMWKLHQGLGLKVDMETAASEAFALGEIYNNGQVTKGGVTISAVDYSFKQNRLLVMIQPERPVTAVEILTEELDKTYLGFFRIHLFGPARHAVSKETIVRFEWYGKAEREVPVGYPMTLQFASDFLYEGDFLCPVGLKFAAEQQAKTSRLLSQLVPSRRITVEVSGVFIFSGYHAFTAISGGGGWQDVAYRYDHARFGLPPTFSPFYPIDKHIHYFLLYQSDFRLILYDTEGNEIPYTFKPLPKSHGRLKNSSVRHRYKVEFTAPNDGSVVFFINDNTVEKTRDNSGAFLAQVVGAR